MLLIWYFIINTYSVYCQHGVILSAGRSSDGIYEGYLWNNNKIVFISPELKASVVPGISKSEKICGFELRSREVKDIPFIVYLLDELSGVGEMQVKPHVYLDYQSRKIFEFTVEAFDCDVLPHYSQGVTVRIHVMNESGPIFNKKLYTFSVRKDEKEGSVVGAVRAKSVINGKLVEYSIQHNENSPFKINQLGMIFIQKSLMSMKKSDFQIRIVAKEESYPFPKQSMVLVTIEIEPVCQNKLTDVPDQLDYYIKSGLTGMMESGQLIQQEHRPILTICHLPSPLRLVTLTISLKSHKSPETDKSLNRKVCQTDIGAFRIQKGICGADPEMFDLLVAEDRMINIDGVRSVGPEILDGLGSNFTFTWWMKRKSKLKSEVFCFQENQKVVSISFENCNILINHPEEILTTEIPSENCHLNRWEFLAITQEFTMYPTLNIWVAGSLVTSVITKVDLFKFGTTKLFVGRCSLQDSNRLAQSSGNKPNSLIDVGVISMIIGKPLKQDAIGCLSSCGEALVIADSITTLNNVKFQRQGPSLILTSANIPQLLDSPMKIHYINSFYMSKPENLKAHDSTDIWMDLSLECESKEIIKIPRAVMRVNFIGPQRDAMNDTNDVEITTNATITASVPNSIQIFPNLQFINANTNQNATKDLKIESCTVRLLQRNLVANEKIYLSEPWSAILQKNNLEIRSNLFLWSIEGETDGVIYEKILRNVLVDMIDERKKFSILCTLKGGDFTNQAVVEIIQLKPNNIHYTIEENSSDLFHQAMGDKRVVYERNKEESFNFLNITKSKFIGVIIMAVIGGAAWALVTAAIICIVLRKKENTRDRKRISNQKNYSKDNISSPHQPPLVTTHDVFLEYEYEEDRTSMADIPDDEEQNLDNISCETCNMADPEVVISAKSIKDLPRSKTITFPIMHRKF